MLEKTTLRSMSILSFTILLRLILALTMGACGEKRPGQSLMFDKCQITFQSASIAIGCGNGAQLLILGREFTEQAQDLLNRKIESGLALSSGHKPDGHQYPTPAPLPGSGSGSRYCARDAIPDHYGCDGKFALDLEGLGRFSLDPETPSILEEKDNGSATLSGLLIHQKDPNKRWSLVATLAGRPAIAPSGSPKKELKPAAYKDGGGSVDPDFWRYYTEIQVQLIGSGSYEGAEVELKRRSSSFQLGLGANGKNVDLGAAGWLQSKVIRAPKSLTQKSPSLNLTGSHRKDKNRSHDDDDHDKDHKEDDDSKSCQDFDPNWMKFSGRVQ